MHSWALHSAPSKDPSRTGSNLFAGFLTSTGFFSGCLFSATGVLVTVGAGVFGAAGAAFSPAPATYPSQGTRVVRIAVPALLAPECTATAQVRSKGRSIRGTRAEPRLHVGQRKRAHLAYLNKYTHKQGRIILPSADAARHAAPRSRSKARVRDILVDYELSLTLDGNCQIHSDTALQAIHPRQRRNGHYGRVVPLYCWSYIPVCSPVAISTSTNTVLVARRCVNTHHVPPGDL
jgi:hypothetical protein